MFGFLKQKVSVDDFGLGVLNTAQEFLDDDCARSLLARYPDYFTHTGNTSDFLAEKGISKNAFALYHRRFIHSCLQAAFTQQPLPLRLSLTRAAMEGYSNPVSCYDFDQTYRSLEQAYLGNYAWNSMVAPLHSSEPLLSYLPYPTAGVANAKYLIESTIIDNVPDHHLFVDEFPPFATSVSAATACVTRAITHLEQQFKISH